MAIRKTATEPRKTAKPASGVRSKIVAGVAEKKQKVKVVRDSFTMPRDEYAKIAEIKLACAEAGLVVKKSEVLRAGLMLLAGLSPVKLKQALGKVEKIKTGRPKKH